MLKDIALFLFTPPGLAIWPGFVALYYFRKKPKASRRWLIATLLLAWFLATPAFARLVSTSIISQVEAPAHINQEEADLIVVLTGGMNYVGNMGWLPSKASYQRAMVAYQVQARVGSRVPIVISGGKTEGVQYPSEAEVVSKLINSKKVQITPTILEETSLNTYESAQEVARIASSRNANTILLVTSDLHMLRALSAFRARGLDPAPIPVFTIKRGALGFTDFLPKISGLQEVHRGLYEIMGVIYYSLAGYTKPADIFYSNSPQQN